MRSSEISQFKDPWNTKAYIVCTDINIFHSMPCSEGTYFNEDYGHCVRDGYNPPICPRNLCKNEAECLLDENEKFKCICKAGFAGEFCEENINECKTAGGSFYSYSGVKLAPNFQGFLVELDFYMLRNRDRNFYVL